MQQAHRTLGLLSFALAATLLVPLPGLAERGDDSDRKSKNGMTTGAVDGVEITLEYGRPKVKGRKIWGGLVPYGKVWRTGADEATTISVSKNALIEGQPLAAGTYSLFTVPGEGEWTVVFNEVAEQWGAYDHDASKDALKVRVAPRDSEHIEELEFAITDGGVALHWEKLAVGFSVAAAP